MDKVVIEKLTYEHVREVCEIEYELIGNVSEDSIKSTLSNDVLSYYVLLLNGEVIGFFECSIISPECELFDIGIKKEFQGMGYSNLLMNYFFELIKQNKCNTVFLEVNSMNNKALNLYKKYGFEQYGVRKNYYGENDAILMKIDVV